MISTSVWATTFEPKPFHASYTMYWKGIQAGTSTQTLKKIGPHRYFFHSETEPTIALIPFGDEEQTTFDWQNDTPQPIHYVSSKTEFGNHTDTDIRFNWKKNTAHFVINDELLDLNIDQKTQDKVTYLFKLQSDLARSEKQLEYWIAGDNKMRHYTFKVAGHEKITVPYGTFDAIKVIQEVKEKKRLTLLWFAPSLQYQLVKVSQFRRGEAFVEADLDGLD